MRVIVVLGLAALVAGCRPDCTPQAGETRPNVILVTVDTLRADHLGCYGGRTARTPHFDRLAAEGALFERSYAQSHVTLPSHLSLLSSLPLADHGVASNVATEARQVTVLPELFAEAGYRVGAFVGIGNLGPQGPLGPLLKRLDVYQGPERGKPPLRAGETNAAVFAWLRRTCDAPFFAWIHYWDPHMPYDPPAPFDAAYYDGDPYDPRATSMQPVALNWFFHQTETLRQRLAARASTVRSLKRELGLSSRRVRRLLVHREGMLDGDGAVDPALRGRIDALSAAVRRELPFKRDLAGWLTGVRDLRFPLARYAGEVAYVDQELGRLQRELEDLGLDRRTILVVTADHGESLGEHGVYFDHFGLHEPDLRVPLIVRAPGRVGPAHHAELARGIDVAPTLLRLAGLDVPPAMQGRDLFGAAPPEEVVAEAARGRQLMVLRDRWKLIRTLKSHYYVESVYLQAGAVELYDVEADPAEAENQAARQTTVVQDLDARLARWAGRHDGTAPAEPPSALSPERERELRALGYIE
jgi:membrane-anchored protein YejM (alkaline phosphatase superfamily)